MNRIVILCGPSCIGKSPLHKALKTFYPDHAGRLKSLVCYHSRDPRPGEKDGVDYYFRSKEYIEALRDKEGFKVIQYRGDTYGVDFGEIRDMLKESDVFYEGNPAVGTVIMDFCEQEKIDSISVFISCVSMEEIEYLKKPKRNVRLQDFLTDVMRRKLLRRTQKQNSILSGKDLDTIELRASYAYEELKLAPKFAYVIANHDGEDSENWDQFYYPLGDARKTLLCFAEILRGNSPEYAESWPEGLLE